MKVAVQTALLALAPVVLQGCSSIKKGVATQATCGNVGGGTVKCQNNDKYSCSNCGSAPCISEEGRCYSCAGSDGNCYKYNCAGTCQTTPCSQNCGTAGGGTRTAANNNRYICTNCGPSPCVSSTGVCYSCFGSDNACYRYRCGDSCSSAPCTSLGAKFVAMSNLTQAEVMVSLAVNFPKTRGVDEMVAEEEKNETTQVQLAELAVAPAAADHEEIGAGDDAIFVEGLGDDNAQEATCGNVGGGTVKCQNNDKYSCSNCGSAPCISEEGRCYSCAGSDGNCYKYNCAGTCQTTPCSQNCGTAGGGTRTAVNNNRYTCTNCGLSPCVSSAGVCYSCFASDNACYRYRCGDSCSSAPCTSLSAKFVAMSNLTQAEVMVSLAVNFPKTRGVDEMVAEEEKNETTKVQLAELAVAPAAADHEEIGAGDDAIFVEGLGDDNAQEAVDTQEPATPESVLVDSVI